MKAHAFDYQSARSLSQACASLGNGETRLISGGQSLGPMLNLRLAQPTALIDVSSLAALRGYQETAEGIIIGAAVTHAEIEDGLLPDTSAGILPRIAAGIAYRSVRNRGTIGGSLAHADPAADWASSLSALNSQVILQRSDGGEASLRRMALGDFLRGAFQTALLADELLLAVFVPRVPSGSRFGYYKFCRKSGELAHAIGAVYTDSGIDAPRAVIGATPGCPIIITGADAYAPNRWAEALDRAAPGLDSIDRAVHLRVLQRALERSELV